MDSVVRVFDAGQFRFSEFTLTGEHLATRRLPSFAGLPVTKVFQLRDGSLLGVTTPRFAWGHSSHNPNIAIVQLHPDGGRADTVVVFRSSGAVWHNEDQILPWGVVPTEFGPGGAWAVLGDSMVAIVDGYEGKARWYRVGPDSLTPIAERELSLESRELTEKDVLLLRDKLLETDPEIEEYAERVELVTPPLWSVARAALFADDGSLWVYNFPELTGAHVWTVFETPGGRRHQVRLPEAFRLERGAVDSRLLYGVWETALGAEIVRVYSFNGGM